MIITCEQCNKKFEIDSKLIPNEGRLLKCGSCAHVWFYKNEIIDESLKVEEKPTPKKEIKKQKIIEDNNEDLNNEKETEISIPKNSNNTPTVYKKKKIGLLNIILVFIISFVGLMLLLETFKNPISRYVPNIEFLLNSLYEIIKDIILFFKDLIN